MQFIGIILLAVSAAISYGIVHDQITARLCLEYFTIGHPLVFHTESPTLLAVGWGIIATWWVGLALGLLLACAGRLGNWPRVSARDLIVPTLVLLAAMGAGAAFFGYRGFYRAT